MFKFFKKKFKKKNDSKLSPLENKSNKLCQMGFFPLKITGDDIHCYWVRVEGKAPGTYHHVPVEVMLDRFYVEALKRAARHEKR